MKNAVSYMRVVTVHMLKIVLHLKRFHHYMEIHSQALVLNRLDHWPL